MDPSRPEHPSAPGRAGDDPHRPPHDPGLPRSSGSPEPWQRVLPKDPM